MSLGARVENLVNESGSIDVHRVRRGLLRSTVRGHIDPSILAVLMRSCDAEAEGCAEGISYFHDWTGVSSYDTAVRIEATNYALAISKPYTKVHVVTQSRLVNMGVAAATLSLQIAGRPFHAYITVESFEREFQRQRKAEYSGM